MKCKNCYLQSKGVDINGKDILYCIGSPEFQPKYGSEKKLTKDRIIFTKEHVLYRANNDDDCHLWSSDRFEKVKGDDKNE